MPMTREKGVSAKSSKIEEKLDSGVKSFATLTIKQKYGISNAIVY